MKKFWCTHFVPLRTMSTGERRDAACWALDHFDSRDLDIFYRGPNDEDGFWFCKETDALMFMLRWGSQ